MSYQIGNAALGVTFTGDLGSLQRTLDQAGGSVDQFGRRSTAAMRGVASEAGRADDAMSRLANGIKGSFVGGSVAVGLINLKNNIMAATGALIDAQVQLDRWQNGFAFGAGGMAQGAREFAFVREEVNRLGLDLGSTAAQYMKMVAASRGSTLAGAQTREVFKSIAEASVVMGMNADQNERAFMAVTQMMSKGKVMAEELRGQLGEHLPGAFSIAARAMGVTEVELNKLMETGQVFSADFLPKFAAQLRKELAGSVEGSSLSMQANLNRLSTAWLNFKQQFAQSGAGSFLSGQIQVLAGDLKVLGDVMEASRQRGEGFWMTLANTAGATAGRAAFGLLAGTFNTFNGTVNALTGNVFGLNESLDLMPANLRSTAEQFGITTQKIQQAQQEYATLSARLAQAPDNIYIKSELGNLARYITRLKEAQDEQRRLMGGGASDPGNESGAEAARLARQNTAAGEAIARRAAQTSARDALLKRYASPAEKLNEELRTQKDLLGDLFTPEIEARIRANFIKPAQAGGSAVRTVADEFERLSERLGTELAAGAAQAQAAQQGLNTAQTDFLKLAASPAWDQLSNTQRADLALLYERRIAQEQMADGLKASALATEALARAEDDRIKGYTDAAGKATNRLDELRAEAQAMAYAEAHNVSLAIAIEQTAMARLREAQAAEMAKGTGMNDSVVLALQQEIDARRQIVEAIAGKEVREAGQKLREDQAAEWARTWDQVGQSFTDALMEGGKSVSEYLKGLFRTLVLRPILAPVGAAMSSLLGGPAMAGQGGAGLGNLGNFSSLQNLLNPSKIFSSFGDSLAFAADSAGQWLVQNTSGVLNQLGGSLMGNANLIGTMGSYAGGAMAGLGFGKAISGGYSAFGKSGNTAVNAGAILGSIFGGPIGGAIGGAIGGLVNRLFGRKLKDSGVEGVFGGAAGFSGSSYAFYKGGLFSSDKTTRSPLDKDLSDALALQYEQLTDGTKSMATALGLSSQAVDNYTRKVRFSTRGLSNDQIVQKLTEQFEGMGEEMALLTLGTTAYTRAGETSAQALARLSTSITTTNGLLGTLGLKLYDVGLSGAAMASDLADRFGGLDAMAQASTAYYQTYYSASERARKTTNAMRDALSRVSMSMPSTTAQLRAMVEGLDLNTEAGRAAYATLVQLAPEFAALQDELRRLASESAKSLIDTFTAGGRLVPALGDVSAALQRSTAAAGDFAEPVKTIHRLLGDAASGVLVFGDRVSTTTAALDPAQLAVLGLHNQVLDLRNAASGTVVDMQGLSAALRGVDTHTFVATVTGVFELIGQRIKATLSQIADERVAVREAAMGIINPGTMTAEQIRQQIAGSALNLPSTQGIDAAQRALASADQFVSAQYRGLDSSRLQFDRALQAERLAVANMDARTNLEQLARAATGNWNNDASFRDIFGRAGVTGPSNLGGLSGMDLTNFIDRLVNIDPNTVAFSSKGRSGWDSVRNPYLEARNQASSDVLSKSSDDLYRDFLPLREQAMAAERAITRQQEALTAALVNQKSATQQAQQAQLNYVDALQQYSLDASRAVTQLGRLRGETVKYYEAQQQLASLMTGTATGLREAVAQYRFDQLDSAAQLASLQERYNVAYSMALSTSGQTLAGYGAQMQQLLQPLLAKAQEAGLTGTQYSGMVSTMLARAEAVANRLDELAPKGFEEESLSLLGQIDSTLAALEAGTKSADQLIVDAVNASKDTTRDGLRAVVAALTGQAVPAFAAGGYHAGGLRIVGENGPELEATGPARIFSAAQTARMFSAGRGDSPALLQELQALRAEVAALRRESVALQTQTVVNTGKAARQLDRWDGDGVPTRNADGVVLQVEQVS